VHESRLILASARHRVLHNEDMRSIALGVLTAVTVGVVAAIGASAAAVAMMPGDSAGEVQTISAIAAPTQSAAVGAATSSVRGGSRPIAAELPPVVELQTAPEATTKPAGSDDSGTDGVTEPVSGTPSDDGTPGDENSGPKDDGDSGPKGPGPKDDGTSGPKGPGPKDDGTSGPKDNSGPKDKDKDAEKAQKDAEKAAKDQAKKDKDARDKAEKDKKDKDKNKKGD
jgi:hypothetical protein